MRASPRVPLVLLRQEGYDLVLFLLGELGPRLHMHPDRNPLLVGKGGRGGSIVASLAVLGPKLST